MGVNIPDLFSQYPAGMLPQFQRLEFLEVLLVCIGTAIWLKMA
jgi:hypothetical protein